MKKAIAALLILASMSAVAADYYVVVPVPGKLASLPITVSLQNAILDDARIGQAYRYDLWPHLQVTGDPNLDLGFATWQATGIPDGLSLASGVLVGTPVEAVAASINVTATYKGRRATQAYSLTVRSPLTITQQNAGYRTWSNGSLAKNCLDYRNPTADAMYAGDTGDGLYRIKPENQDELTVYCDMTRDGGGWTLAARVISGSNAHVTSAAVGMLTSPGQLSVAKLSDGHINALMNPSSGILRLDAVGASTSRSNYYKLNSTPFAAEGAAIVRPVSVTLSGPYVSTTLNIAHGGLNSFGALALSDFLVYGPSAAGDACRVGIAWDGAGAWCGPGASGALFVR